MIGRNAEATGAIREAKRRGFRVTTNTTFFSDDTPETVREVLDFLNDELEVDQMMISPAYAYWKAPDQEHFLPVEETRRLFAEAFAGGRRKRWRLNHSPLFLDFLEGKVDYECTPWGIPSYSVFGWQRPCYLQSDGYVPTYRELVETTDWSKDGRGNYWSDNPAFDLNGDGIADTAYRPNDLVDRVLWTAPAAKVLINSPAVQVLRWAQAQFPALYPGGVVDTHPLMAPPPTRSF